MLAYFSAHSMDLLCDHMKRTTQFVCPLIIECHHSIYTIHWDSKLLASVFCFAELTLTGLKLIWAEQEEPYTLFLQTIVAKIIPF